MLCTIFAVWFVDIWSRAEENSWTHEGLRLDQTSLPQLPRSFHMPLHLICASIHSRAHPCSSFFTYVLEVLCRALPKGWVSALHEYVPEVGHRRSQWGLINSRRRWPTVPGFVGLSDSLGRQEGWSCNALREGWLLRSVECDKDFETSGKKLGKMLGVCKDESLKPNGGGA